MEPIVITISVVVFLWAAVGLVGRGFPTVEQQLLSGFSRLFCSPLAGPRFPGRRHVGRVLRAKTGHLQVSTS